MGFASSSSASRGFAPGSELRRTRRLGSRGSACSRSARRGSAARTRQAAPLLGASPLLAASHPAGPLPGASPPSQGPGGSSPESFAAPSSSAARVDCCVVSFAAVPGTCSPRKGPLCGPSSGNPEVGSQEALKPLRQLPWGSCLRGPRPSRAFRRRGAPEGSDAPLGALLRPLSGLSADPLSGLLLCGPSRGRGSPSDLSSAGVGGENRQALWPAQIPKLGLNLSRS